MTPKQYDIVPVNPNPTINKEINTTRPCIVISPNEMNDHLQTIIIAPMTSTSKNYPARVQASKDSHIVLDQIKSRCWWSK